jgi:hypothetical protein
MSLIYVLAMCAVMNNQIVPDRCEVAPGAEWYTKDKSFCDVERIKYLYTFVGITPDKVKGRALVQWKAPNSGPFNTTVVCMTRSVPTWEPVQ